MSPCPRGKSSPLPPGGSPLPTRAPKGRAHCWQLLAIMQDGTWRTPYELHELTGIGILSITARLRNLREPQYGACQLNVRQRQGAPTQTYEYQIIPPMGATISAAPSSSSPVGSAAVSAASYSSSSQGIAAVSAASSSSSVPVRVRPSQSI